MNNFLKNQRLKYNSPLIWGVILVWGFSQPTWSQTASELFDRYQRAVFQVRTIDLASGDKSSIGSGFALADSALIGTNFHVVSQVVHSPETFRLEILDHNGDIYPAQVVAIDIVHDLALLNTETRTERGFRLRSDKPKQGDPMFSMGNPQDLGMTIIDGTYNGLVEHSRYQKILFSGSLNSGMSGGPALDASGRLLGINVAKGGEQLSFLVPVQHLKNLLQSQKNDGAEVSATLRSQNFAQQIRTDLMNDQATFYSELIEKVWEKQPFGELMVPKEISASLKCWGHTLDDDDLRYESVHQHCQSNDVIYVDDSFYTGQFDYDHEWLKAGELNSLQFYSALQGRFEHTVLHNISSEDDAGNYECITDRVNIAGSRWKVSSCFRAYRDYTGLYDALLLMASLDRPRQGAIIKAAASGISRNSANALFAKIMRSVEWKP